MIRFEMLILFSASVSSAFKTLSSVNPWPREFQVPDSLVRRMFTDTDGVALTIS